jgi:hypothetical protein
LEYFVVIWYKCSSPSQSCHCFEWVRAFFAQNIFSLSSAALSTDLSYPQMTNIHSFSEFVNVSKILQVPIN